MANAVVKMEKTTTAGQQSSSISMPLVSSYNDHIRPLLDAVDRLRQLNVTKEGIQLPTIVVVGDQSSGKSSVLESLAGISLPRGQGICTRVPLIMRLQDQPDADKPELMLEYMGKEVRTSETGITEAISTATDEIAGDGKGISNAPLTLIVKKKGVPDLTMVDLPGITRVPVHGQPENIYEQISEIIMEYITPKESIILNVLSATVDFPTCESIRMSQMVDRNGERTLAVVTKSDKAPEGLLEKVTSDDVNIGLGYVCVRNRIGQLESYAEARAEEKRLFDSHPLLSKIDKSMVGIPVLAERLVQIQATIIGRCLPDIVKKINEKLNHNLSELNNMPQSLTTAADAMRAFLHVVGATKETLRKLLIMGEYDEFPDEPSMHGTARIAAMLAKYGKDLPMHFPDAQPFLKEEISAIEECKDLGLSNFLSRSAFLLLLNKRIKHISSHPEEFCRQVWEYVEKLVTDVLMLHAKNYPQLLACTKRAVHNLMETMRDRSFTHVKELVEMEMAADYTCNPDYLKTWSDLMEGQGEFIKQVTNLRHKMSLKMAGAVSIEHLWSLPSPTVEQAFDMKMRLTAYWKIVSMRLQDNIALHLLFSLKKIVERDFEKARINEIVGGTGGIERMLEEPSSTGRKRERLTKSVQLLKDSKMVVANIIDRLVAGGK